MNSDPVSKLTDTWEPCASSICFSGFAPAAFSEARTCDSPAAIGITICDIAPTSPGSTTMSIPLLDCPTHKQSATSSSLLARSNVVFICLLPESSRNHMSPPNSPEFINLKITYNH